MVPSAKKKVAWPEGKEAEAACSIKGVMFCSTNGLGLSQKNRMSSVIMPLESKAARKDSHKNLGYLFLFSHQNTKIPAMRICERYSPRKTMISVIE